jgi:protein-disulfide isomerase
LRIESTKSPTATTTPAELADRAENAILRTGRSEELRVMERDLQDRDTAPRTSVVTFAAMLVVMALIVFMGLLWAGNRSLVQTVDTQIARIDSRMAQLESRASAPVAAPAAAAPPAAAAAPSAQAVPIRVDTRGAPSLGPADAPIVIAEYSDFQCVHCANVRTSLDRVRQVYGDRVRLVWKHNPLPMHKESRQAHLASLAAHEQGKFWEYHDKLFSDPNKLSRENLLRYARELGLDIARFQSALDTKRHEARLQADLADAAAFQFTAAPAFMINSRSLIGAHQFEGFAKVINYELRELDLPIPPEVAHLQTP